LVFISKVANRIPVTEACEGEKSKIKAPTLAWLTSKLRREVNAEVVLQPKCPTKVIVCLLPLSKIITIIKELECLPYF
jgi:hypothetical protein